MKRLMLPGLLLALGVVTSTALFRAPMAQAASEDHKVAICHGTASAKNPYVLIIVDERAKATHLNGHGKNNAPDFALNGGNVLTDEQIAYYRGQDAGSACGCPPPAPTRAGS